MMMKWEETGYRQYSLILNGLVIATVKGYFSQIPTWRGFCFLPSKMGKEWKAILGDDLETVKTQTQKFSVKILAHLILPPIPKNEV
jgi:hypothetical protein